MKKYSFLIVLIFMINFMIVFAENDDDDIMGEIIVDLLIGVAVEICSHSTTCSAIMTIIVIISENITLLTICDKIKGIIIFQFMIYKIRN